MSNQFKLHNVPKSSLTSEQLREVNTFGEKCVKEFQKIPLRANKKKIRTTKSNSIMEVPFSAIRLKGIPTPLHICNCVATYNLGCEVNLYALAFLLRGKLPTRYNPEGFAAMRLAVKSDLYDLTSHALIFGNGQVVHTGGKNELHLLQSAHSVCLTLRKLTNNKIIAHVHNFRIQNIVATFQFGQKLDGNVIANRYKSRATYNPEKIQCCFIRSPMQNSNRVYLVFASGSVVITGNKKRSDIEESFQDVWNIATSIQHLQTTSPLAIKNLNSAKMTLAIQNANKDLARLSHIMLENESSGRRKTSEERKNIELSKNLMITQVKQIIRSEEQNLLLTNSNETNDDLFDVNFMISSRPNISMITNETNFQSMPNPETSKSSIVEIDQDSDE